MVGICTTGVANPHGRPPLLPLATMLGESSSNGRSLRKPAVADRGLGRLNRAENPPTGVASGRTGVSEKAAVPLGSRNTLHRPSETISICSAIDHPRPERDIGGDRRHHLRANG